jgi:putative spermidine/putrescine transport system permease protein
MGRGKWTKRILAAYFCLFLLFLYGPMLVMAVLSFQGPQGGISFPMRGVSLYWWEALLTGPRSGQIRETATRSLQLGVVVGILVAFLSLTLTMAYRRRFRGDNAVFALVMLALMTPGILLSLGTSLFWQLLDRDATLWTTALGTNVIWGLPFGFLVMVAVWNRYSNDVEEASRDLGAGAFRTFREVTLPLIWTGLLGAFLFGFTLSWNEYDRTALLAGGENTLPLQIFAMTIGAVIRPDLYALGTATTLVSLLAIGIFLAVAGILGRRRDRGAAVTHSEELGEIATGATHPELGAPSGDPAADRPG